MLPWGRWVGTIVSICFNDVVAMLAIAQRKHSPRCSKNAFCVLKEDAEKTKNSTLEPVLFTAF